MIDQADKQTQALPLEQQPAKRKRGRPATGKAMTPAEKQRAYRERTKRSNVTVNANYDTWLVDQAKMIQELESKLAAAIARAEEAEKANKGNVAENTLEDSGEWTLEFKFPRSGGWVSCDEPSTDLLSGKPKNFKKVAEHVRLMNDKEKDSKGPKTAWRAVRDDGLIFEPKVPRSRGKRPAAQ